MFLAIGIDIDRVAATTGRPAGMAIDQDLWCEHHVRPGAVSGDVDPVGEGAGGGVGPAAAAVLRQVLITGQRQVVNAIDIPPVPGCGKLA